MKRSTPEFRNLVTEKFVRCAVENAVRKGETRILCPCIDCKNLEKVLTPNICVDHLVLRGFMKDYTRWIFHGEHVITENIEVPSVEIGESVHDDDIERDRIDDLIGDMQVNFEDEPHVLDKLFIDSEKPLYPNCDKYTRLSSVMRLMSLKVENRWSDKSFTALLELLNDMLPEGHALPKSTYEAKKILCPIGCDYQKIHACPNDCILYRNEYENLHECPTCGASRYHRKDKGDGSENKKGSAAKVVWYLPIIPRFKRLFANVDDANKLRWHAEMRKKDGKLRHPADAPQWRTIDRIFPEFGEEARNLRLGLCTDGMNPYSTLSSQHSTWPVLLCIYNLPPYLCMKRKYLMLSLLIQGPKQPGNDIDVYLAPLIDDLKLLWDKGVKVYDAVAKEDFTLHAMLLCTINDFPAYGNLSGYSNKGKKACPICGEDTVAPWLTHSGKNVYVGHRRFLPRYHPYRKMKKAFNGKIENELAPIPLEGDKVFDEVKNIDVVFGKPNKFPKNSKYKKRSIFWNLPYWQHLSVRHCIDIMHVEKNVAESLIGTLLNIPGKTKDGYKARKDIEEMGTRKELAPQENGKRAYLPPACYTLSKKEKTIVCECLRGIKVPHGYSSNMKNLVSMKDLRLNGLKSHDNHVLMQHFFPISIRSVLPKEVRIAVTRLCFFFNAIYSKVIDLDTLDKLQADAVETLCQLEMYFPPSFFDISEHLIVHLVREVKLLGPVHLRDMYAFERYMGILKGYTTNRYRPDASIVEGYISAEVIRFCMDYLAGVRPFGLPKSRHEGRLEGKGTIGAKWVSLGAKELNDAHFLVLQHLTEVHPYLEAHMRELRAKYPLKNEKWLVKEHNKCFVQWFRVKVLDELSRTPDNVAETVKWLAYGPNNEVKSFEGYDINGYCFYTQRQDTKSTMQNSGVTLVASATEFDRARDSTPIHTQMSYYGIIEDIWELHYRTFTIPLFKCKWVDSKKGVRVDEFGFTLADFSRPGYKNEPLIMASQAKQVFYIMDPLNNNWSVVLQSKRRILGVDDVVDEEEYDQFDDIPPFSEGLPSMPIQHNLEPNYVRVDHNEGIWDVTDNH